LLATLPTVLPAPFALSPTALRTASTFECLLDDPFEREAPLFERDLLLDFGLAFEAFGFDDDLGFDAFDFEAGFAAFEVDAFLGFDVDFDLGFDFDLGADLVLV